MGVQGVRGRARRCDQVGARGCVGVDRGIRIGRAVAGESRGSKSMARPRHQEVGVGGVPRAALERGTRAASRKCELARGASEFWEE